MALCQALLERWALSFANVTMARLADMLWNVEAFPSNFLVESHFAEETSLFQVHFDLFIWQSMESDCVEHPPANVGQALRERSAAHVDSLPVRMHTADVRSMLSN